MGFQEKKYITEAEYLEFERNATEKHEYFQGEIRLLHRNDDAINEVNSMGGASKSHNEIFSNIFGELKIKLKGKPCRPYGSDFRVNIPNLTLYTYPGISVVCNEPNLTDSEMDTFTNPTLIIEILSKSTRNYDLGGKFLLYKQIESLKEYLLIDSDEIKVIKFFKNADNSWLMTEINANEESFRIDSIQLELQLNDVYENVKFV
jgi:Uma2 family endonuclease